MKTISANINSVSPRWLRIDASDQVLGRLASKVAVLLRGKHKAEYTAHVDTGDYVILYNVEKIRVTGNKAQDKTYYRHSRRPGGLKSINYQRLIETHPERVIRYAVKGMLPKTILGRNMMRKLKIYRGADEGSRHPAQKPIEVKL